MCINMYVKNINIHTCAYIRTLPAEFIHTLPACVWLGVCVKLCVCVEMCMRLYIQYVCIYIHLCMYIHVYIYTHISTSPAKIIHTIPACVWVCEILCVRGDMYEYKNMMNVQIYTYVFKYMYTYRSTSPLLSLSI